jgi:hypothetical protein
MPEMRRIDCPSCTAGNVPLAVVDGIEEYRCRKCGLVYYGPCGCDIDRSAPPEAPAQRRADRLHGDWQMSRVPPRTEGAVGVPKYPGCS